MKKLAAIMLSLCLLCAGLALAESDALVGNWYLNSISINGTPVSATDLDLGLTMTLDADGTGFSKGSGSVSNVGGNLTWTFDGNKLTIDPANADPSTATLEDGNLVWDVDGTLLIFTREEPEGTDLPNPIEATGEDQFLGKWEGDFVVINGVTLPLQGSDLDMGLDISSGFASVTYSGKTVPALSSFSNGKLYLKDGNADIEVTLCDDGHLMMALESGDKAGQVYYTKVN